MRRILVCMMTMVAIQPLQAATTVLVFGAPNVETVSFSKPAGADFNAPEFQDALSSTVVIARQSQRGIYNILEDSALQLRLGNAANVIGTRWAFEGLNGNGLGAAFGDASNYANLNFADWGQAIAARAINQEGRAAVVHLLADDIYFDLEFTAWGGAGGGAFSYDRAAAAVPEPSAALLLVGCSVLFVRRKR